MCEELKPIFLAIESLANQLSDRGYIESTTVLSSSSSSLKLYYRHKVHIKKTTHGEGLEQTTAPTASMMFRQWRVALIVMLVKHNNHILTLGEPTNKLVH